MKSDIGAGKSGKPIGVINALSRAGATQPSPQASHAPSIASTIPLQHMVPVHSVSDGSQTSQPTETWYINMIVPAQKILMVARLDGAEYALLDSGSGLTSCPNNYADDLPLLLRPVNLECIGLGTSRTSA